MKSIPVTIAITLAIAGTLLLGCAQSQPSTPAQSPKPTATTSPSPTASPTASPKAEKPTLPREIVYATSAEGTKVYAIGAAYAAAASKISAMKVTVRPYPTNLEQVLALEEGIVHMAQMAGENTYGPAYGTAEYAKAGPRPLRALWFSVPSNLGLVARRDSIKSWADVKGKRLAWPNGSPSHMTSVRGMLAYGGLTTDDMILVNVGDTATGFKATLEGAADIAYSGVTASWTYELAASRAGVYYPSFAPDKEAWARVNKVVSIWYPSQATYGGGIDKNNPVWVCGSPAPINGVAKLGTQVAYEITRIWSEGYELYKGGHVDLPFFTVDTALNDIVMIPYHEGSVQYFKDKGLWTPKAEEKQAAMLKAALEREKK